MPRAGLVTVILFVFSGLLAAQQTCPPLRAPAPDPSSLLFTPQQEMDLGDVMAEHVQRAFLVIDDEELTGYLRQVGASVARQLPESNLQYRFYLYDLPQVQAFGMPGGRVFVSRKMVAFLRSEDELAGLLAHELGHLVARQPAVDFSRIFRSQLGVRQLSDRKEIFERYNELVESVRMKKFAPHSGGEAEREQLVADQIAVQAMARAGYGPQVFPDLFDRIAQTKGNTGNWLSNLFGTTRPASKRLRELLKDVAALPSGCIEALPARRPEDFKTWQVSVLHYRGLGHKEKLHGVQFRKKLNDPLRADIEHFRFSPDGKYLLAQDDGAINVLTRDPLAFRFRIDAPDARFAEFSPDSRQVVFHTTGLRVETWDIERQEQSSLNEVVVLKSCRETSLSPDGKILACYGAERDLTLYDTATSEPVFKKEEFSKPFGSLGALGEFFETLMRMEGLPLVRMVFSPDARYFVAGTPDRHDLAFDLTNGKEIKLRGSMNKILYRSFVFLGPDRLVGLDTESPGKSMVVRFPSGEVLDRFPFGDVRLTAASNPRYVLVRPLGHHPVGIYDLQTKKIVYANRMSALDVWGDIAVAERLNGEIGFYPIGELKPTNTLQLPLGRLGRLRSISVSPDLKWLALSSRTRGAVWNLEANDRTLFVRGFRGSYFSDGMALYMDFPKFEKAARELGALDLRTKVAVAAPLEKQEKGTKGEGNREDLFFGPVFARTSPLSKDNNYSHNVQLDVLDTPSGKTLWSRTFPKRAPAVRGAPDTDRLVLLWPANSDGVRAEINGDPALQERFGRTSAGEEDSFLEVVDSRSGTKLGAALVLTGKGSFQIREVYSTGPWIVVTDTTNRVLLYSLASGQEHGKVFGVAPVVSPTGNMLCVTNERGQLALHDLPSMAKRDELFFASRIVLDRFSSDGMQLLVLTDDQTAYVLDLKGTTAQSGAGKP